MLLSLCSHLRKPNLETAVAKPQEDGLCSHYPSCLGGAFINRVLVMSGLLVFVCSALVEKVLSGMLVEKLLAMSSLLLFTSSMLVEKALVMSSLLLVMSRVLDKKTLAGCCLLAVVLVLPQFFCGALSVPVGFYHASKVFGRNRPHSGDGGSSSAACWSLQMVQSIQILFSQSIAQLGGHGGGCIHLYCSHLEVSKGASKDKDK
jgi:hypothetical protein